jgi:hypothetical protein
MNLNFLNNFDINKNYKKSEICYIGHEIWSSSIFKKDTIYNNIKLIYFASFDRGVGNWTELNDYLKFSFPNLETLVLNENYSSLIEALKFITNSWIKNILVFDSQTTHTNEEIISLRKNYDENKFYITKISQGNSSYVSYFDITPNYIHMFCVMSDIEFDDLRHCCKFKRYFEEYKCDFLCLDPYEIVE